MARDMRMRMVRGAYGYLTIRVTYARTGRAYGRYVELWLWSGAGGYGVLRSFTDLLPTG